MALAAGVSAALGCSVLVDTSNLSGGSPDVGADASAADEGVDTTSNGPGDTRDDSTKADAIVDSAIEAAIDSTMGDAPKDVPPVDVIEPDGTVVCPADMVSVAGPTSSYCVDATEVTAGAYKTWLDGSPSTAGQPPECAWNASFDPIPTVPYPSGWWPPDSSHLSDPVRWVDWCDAAAYCTQHGKHLCRAFDGGRVDYATGIADPSKSQWMRACSANGTRKFCFGDTDDGTTCAEKPSWSYPVPVGSLTGCTGGYPGLWDMSGNIEEWEDNCQTPVSGAGAGDECKTRGGSYGSTDVSCAGFGYQTRQTNVMWVGFRCCKD